MSTLPAVISLRVSTDEQAEEGYSIAAQERACRQHCEMLSWPVVAVLADEGLSGTLEPAERPGLAAALELLRTGQAKALVVHKLDRLARSVRIANELIEEFQRRGIAFVAVADRIDLSTPFGWAAFQMQNVWNELYIKNLSFETAKGHREKAKQGGWVGPVPIGYQRNGKTLAPSDDAVVITQIFEWYASGVESYTSIADKLNAAGYRTLDWKTGQRGLFGRESVRTILRNRSYLGYVSSGGMEFTGLHPALISEDLWNRTVTIRDSRERAGVYNVTPLHGEMLSGMVYCAECGSKMHRFQTGRNSSRVARYSCSGRRAAGERHRDCNAPMANQALVERAVIDLLSEIRITNDLKILLEEEIARALTAPTVERRVDRAAITAKLERLGEIYADGVLSKEKYQQQRKALMDQLAEEALPMQPLGPSAEAVLSAVMNLPQLLAHASPAEARAVLAPALSHVWVEDKNIRAITPTLAFRPLFCALWRCEVEMGCLTGFEPATS